MKTASLRCLLGLHKMRPTGRVVRKKLQYKCRCGKTQWRNLEG